MTFDSLGDVGAWVNGYDLGVCYADHWIGKLVDELKNLGIFDETMIIVSADHGENLGELNIWGDHHTADHWTCRIPLIVRMPFGHGGGRTDNALHYHFDWAATSIDLVNGLVPGSWDAKSFASSLREGKDKVRDFMITSQGAWSCQRGIRFRYLDRNYLCLVTYHDGYKNFSPIMLFDLDNDPHETQNLADLRPEATGHATRLLTLWLGEMMRRTESDVNPLMTVMREGGPFHCQGALPAYLERLEKTGRGKHAEALRTKYCD